MKNTGKDTILQNKDICKEEILQIRSAYSIISKKIKNIFMHVQWVSPKSAHPLNNGKANSVNDN